MPACYFLLLYSSHMNLRERIASLIKGDITDDAAVRQQYDHDTSIFERTPAMVVFPKDADDVSTIVRAVRVEKTTDPHISLAARSAGTDMTGGSLTDGVSVVFTKYMNH